MFQINIGLVQMFLSKQCIKQNLIIYWQSKQYKKGVGIKNQLIMHHAIFILKIVYIGLMFKDVKGKREFQQQGKSDTF